MLVVSIKAEFDKLAAAMAAEQKRIRFAAAIALTHTAKQTQIAVREEMPRAFKRPTPYALNATYIRPARPDRLESVIGIKDQMEAGKGTPGIRFLGPQIHGGQRAQKRFERALQARGLLPRGMVAVPAAAAKLDSYGNMSRGQIVQILSALGAAETRAGYSANRTARSTRRRKNLPQYFVGRPGGGRLPLGIWQSFRFAVGSAVKPVMLFVRDAQYRVRLDMAAITGRVAARELGAKFQAEMKRK